MSLHLYSEVFAQDEHIPAKFTCDGEDISPPLEWAGAPEGTQSYALICDDPDAPGGTFSHWAIRDIPADVTFLPGGHSRKVEGGAYPEGRNDFGTDSYGGPCPPAGHGAHHYRFRILALDAPRIEVPEGAKVPEVEQAARKHMLAEAELVGYYEREG